MATNLTVNNANVVFKDNDGNVGKIKSLTDSDVSKISTAIGVVNTHTSTINTLTSSLSGEISARANADTTIQKSVTDLSNACVKLTGNQTVAGTKTFSSVVKAVTPSTSTLDTSVATTAWVENYIASKWDSTVLEHNNVCRKANLLSGHFSSVSDIISAIQSGNFKDIYIGDYFPVTYTIDGSSVTSNMRIAGINFFTAGSGEWGCHTNHVVIVPDTTITSYMNSTNTTAGGYVGSFMYTTTIPKIYNALAGSSGTPFYGHVPEMYESVTNGMNSSAAAAGGIAGWTGATTGWQDTKLRMILMSEPEVYGFRNFGNAADNVRCFCQLPMFKVDHTLINMNGTQWHWLRSVAGSTGFCCAYHSMRTLFGNASDVLHVRPRFIIS